MIRLLVLLLALPALMFPVALGAAQEGFEHSLQSFASVASAGHQDAEDPQEAPEDLRGTSTVAQGNEAELEHEYALDDALIPLRRPHLGVDRPRRAVDPEAPHPERTTPPPEAGV